MSRFRDREDEVNVVQTVVAVFLLPSLDRSLSLVQRDLLCAEVETKERACEASLPHGASDPALGSTGLGTAGFLTIPKASCLTVRNLLCLYVICDILAQKLKLMHLPPPEPHACHSGAEQDTLSSFYTSPALGLELSVLVLGGRYLTRHF